MDRCSACLAQIIWAKHEKTGKTNPIDAEPSDDGNIVLSADGYRIVPKPERADFVGRLHKSHFVTCPDAQRFRGGR